MAFVLVAFGTEEAFEVGLVTALCEAGMDASAWSRTVDEDQTIDLIVAGLDEILEFSTASDGTSCPPLLALVDAVDPSEARRAIRAGATALLDRHLSLDELVDLVQQCGGGTSFCPAGLLAMLVDRLEEPPRPLQADEERFLALAITLTIEEVGIEIGLSRRQAQRRFKAICNEFGFKNHLEAAVTATRWGL